ncbi:hypothetical protein ACF0H5_007379 [Mactra antiquata]
MSTSLPPLTKYHIIGRPRSKWGEDETMDQFVLSGLSRCSCNFDACHPVLEGPEVKYEGYMYPKALRHNLCKFHSPVVNTGRHVPRNSTCEVFPRNNQARKSLTDGRYVLGETTRKSIEDYFSLLYRTTHYDNIYRDTSRHMMDRLSRDKQYYFEGPNYVEAPTCTRVHNHPDPCHHCWTGGYNKDFKLRLEEFQSKLQDFRETVLPLCANGQISHCKGCASLVVKNDEKCACAVTCSLEKAREENVDSQKKSCCTDCKSTTKADVENNKVEDCGSEKCNEIALCACPGRTHIGTRLDSIPVDRDENILLRSVYQFKLPSCKHCKETENDFAHNVAERHSLLNHDCSLNTPWLAKCRTRNNKTSSDKMVQENNEDDTEEQTDDVDNERSKLARNSWIFRDENNLRRPCIAKVLGNFNKTNAHKRYHDLHPDCVPDVRDNTRYSKRVQFYGYNSSVYR